MTDTNDNNSFFAQYKRPEWQKKRLEVLEEAGWVCSNCESEDKQLEVHHSYYEKDKKPWEYPTQSLHCLCGECHKDAQDINKLLKQQLGKIEIGTDHKQLLGYAMALETQSFPMVTIDVLSYEHAQGIADCWGLTAEEIIAVLREGRIDGYTLDKLRRAKRKKDGNP